MDMKQYYKDRVEHLETPEFLNWFKSWYGDDSAYAGASQELIDGYWSERRFALMGWHAAMLPCAVSADKRAFVVSLGPYRGVDTD